MVSAVEEKKQAKCDKELARKLWTTKADAPRLLQNTSADRAQMVDFLVDTVHAALHEKQEK